MGPQSASGKGKNHVKGGQAPVIVCSLFSFFFFFCFFFLLLLLLLLLLLAALFLVGHGGLWSLSSASSSFSWFRRSDHGAVSDLYTGMGIPPWNGPMAEVQPSLRRKVPWNTICMWRKLCSPGQCGGWIVRHEFR